jgi:hypothetical protein
MQAGSQLRPFAALLTVIITVSLAADGQSPPTSSSLTTTSDSVLPRNVVIPLSVVNRFFPEVTLQISTGKNVTAVGKPKATRSVIYANRDNSKKVTITVDAYATPSGASSAYQEAVQKSKIVPGFKPISAPNLGENAFVGTVTQGAETHIGLGALNAALIVGVTLVGYEPTPGNITNLISLSREEEAAARAALDRNGQNQSLQPKRFRAKRV